MKFDDVSITVLVALFAGVFGLLQWLAQQRRRKLVEGDVLVGAAMNRLGIGLADASAQTELEVLSAAARCKTCVCITECRAWLQGAPECHPPENCANHFLLEGLSAESKRANDARPTVVVPLRP